MDDHGVLKKKIDVHGIISCVLGSLLITNIVILTIIVNLSITLLLAQVVLGSECILAGFLGQAAARSPSIISVTRYSRMQFILLITWGILGALSIYLEIIILAEISNALVITLVIFSSISVYLAFCYLFYLFLKYARQYATNFMGLTEGLNPGNAISTGHNSSSASEYSNQVVYPGQAYRGNPGLGAYAGQPIYPIEPSNPNLLNTEQNENNK